MNLLFFLVKVFCEMKNVCLSVKAGHGLRKSPKQVLIKNLIISRDPSQDKLVRIPSAHASFGLASRIKKTLYFPEPFFSKILIHLTLFYQNHLLHQSIFAIIHFIEINSAGNGFAVIIFSMPNNLLCTCI